MVLCIFLNQPKIGKLNQSSDLCWKCLGIFRRLSGKANIIIVHSRNNNLNNFAEGWVIPTNGLEVTVKITVDIVCHIFLM